MTRRRRPKSKLVEAHASEALSNATHGHCTAALNALGKAHEAYGKTRGGRQALGEAKIAFFRKCVVPR
jgi:hypothetical protein